MRTWMILGGVFFLLTACGAMAEVGPPILPEAAELDGVTITAGELALTSEDEDFILWLLEALEQSVKGNSGMASIQDLPNKGVGLVRLDFSFQAGGASTVFLYREGERLLLEQPYQGIWELDGALEGRLRAQIDQALARGQTIKQE